MATSTEQINDLIAGNAALKAFFEGERDALIAARNDLPSKINRIIYVDEANGALGNDGATPAAPMLTIDDALASLKRGQSASIRLLSNVTWRDRIDLFQCFIQIVSYNADGTGTGAPQRMIMHPAVADNNPAAPSGAGMYGASCVLFSNVNHQMGGIDPAETDPVFTSFGHLAVNYVSSNLNGGAGLLAPLVSPDIGSFSISLQATTHSNMAGRWVKGIASGTAITPANSGGLVDPAITNS